MSRIYMVSDKEAPTGFFVRANSKGAALRFIAERNFECTVATHDQLYDAMNASTEIFNAVIPEQVDIDDTVEPPSALAAAFRTLEDDQKRIVDPTPPPPAPPSSSTPAKPAAKVDEFKLPGKKIGEPSGFQAPPKQDEF